MGIDYSQITAKSIELSKCFINKSSGIHESELEVSRQIGDLARFSANIRQAGILNENQIKAVTNALQMDYRLVKSSILPQLNKLGWATIKQKGTNKIETLSESIPPSQDILKILGQEWESQEPTDIDFATIKSLSSTSKAPITKEALLSEVGLSGDKFERMLSYGFSANYLGEFQAVNIKKDCIWSPFYWYKNPDRVKKFLEKSSDNKIFSALSGIMEGLQTNQGYPIENAVYKVGLNPQEYQSLLQTTIQQGFFPTVKLKIKNKEYHYLFPVEPQFSIEPSSDLFEKARMIVACIRHGEYHAEGSTIKYPLLILKRLISDGLNAHTYTVHQYATLIFHRIVEPEEAGFKFGNKAYRINFIKTPENLKAADIAKEMLKGELPLSSVKEFDASSLLSEGMFAYSSEQRVMKSREKIYAKNEFNTMLEWTHGGVNE